MTFVDPTLWRDLAELRVLGNAHFGLAGQPWADTAMLALLPKLRVLVLPFADGYVAKLDILATSKSLWCGWMPFDA